MITKLEKIKKFRSFLLQQIESLTVQQLNKIPAGYNNNIIWNSGHLIAVVQTMCYVRSGLSLTVENKYCNPYLSGTKPENFVTEQEIAAIKKLLISTIDELQRDIEKNIFQHYTPSVMIPKVYGFEVNNIEEAIDYLLYHEGLHAGYILSLKRLL